MRNRECLVLCSFALSVCVLGCQRSSHEHPAPQFISTIASGASQEVSAAPVSCVSSPAHVSPVTSGSETSEVVVAPPSPDAPGPLLPPGPLGNAVLNATPLYPQIQHAGNSSRIIAQAMYTTASNGDLTASPDYDDFVFAHAADYSWLSGELHYAEVRNAWRLHFASPNDDCYGGSVTLILSGRLEQFHSGQRVRVEGRMVNPTSREPSPPYQVDRIQILSHQ